MSAYLTSFPLSGLFSTKTSHDEGFLDKHHTTKEVVKTINRVATATTAAHDTTGTQKETPKPTLKVIGVGLQRTGTTSLQAGLDILGYSRCHLMS